MYEHYTTTLNRICDPFSRQPQRIEFVFTCKTHPENHLQPLRRDRSKTGDGTTKFLKDVRMCEEKQGIYQPQSAPNSVPYSPETHRALIALRCAKHSHPINSILDDDYRTEVEMLRPGTTLPHSTTVQRDLINIYIHMSTFVMNYFMVKLTLLYCFGGKLNNISRHLVLLCILHWMDGQVPLLLPTLGLLSSGMQMVQ